MPDQRLPVVRDMEITAFNGGTITDYSSYMQNIMVEQVESDTGKRLVATQRPAINMLEDASDTVAKTQGRGIYFWDAASADYFVNDDTIYKSGYATSIGTITTGTKKVSFHEVGAVLVVVDPENNQAWTITTGGTLTEITDVDFPATISGGGTVLDGYLFLMDDDGVIQHSDLDDATSWDALNFIEAEREPDDGVYLGKHHDNIVAFGRGTIEFFYNAGNATGSTLSRRQDIFYNLGCPYEDGVWEDGDDLYFLGRTQRGDFGIYVISNFQLKKISSPSFNTYLTSVYAEGSFFPLLTGFSVRGHNFIAVTVHTVNGDIDPIGTFVFDPQVKIWGIWETDMTELSSIMGFPVAGWTTSSASRFGTGILTNGDLITLKSTFTPIDAFDIKFYVEDQDDYVVTDYIANFGSTVGTNISITTRLGHLDSNTNKNKFGRTLEIVSDYTAASQTLTVKWSDTDHSTFTSTRTIDMSSRQKLSRIGMFNRRTYQLEYSGNEVVRLESLEYDIAGGYV